MAWVLGIGVSLVLLFAFPKQMIALLVLAAVAVGGFLYLMHLEDVRRIEANERDRAQVAIRAKADSKICNDPRYPVMVELSNRSSSRTLNSVYFSLAAHKPGYSGSVVNNTHTSDKILAPGEKYVDCWSLDSWVKPPEGYTYDMLQWDASTNSVTWR
jgi:hypothetical protein